MLSRSAAAVFGILLSTGIVLSGDASASISAEYEVLSPREADYWSSLPLATDADPETLPPELYESLLEQVGPKLTNYRPSTMQEIFRILTQDPKARMSQPRGACRTRSRYIQKFFKQVREADTGYLYIKCPGNRGKLQVTDRSTGETIVYRNFHWANVVEIVENGGRDFNVIDVQFQDGPVSLSKYLAELSIRQRLRPMGPDGISNRDTCYWQVQLPDGS